MIIKYKRELTPRDLVMAHDASSSLTGFTLIELLISISIISVIMSVVFFNYGIFNDQLALTSAGQEMAIAVRQTQTYGLSVKEISPGSGKFDRAYGVHFDPSDPEHYYLFVDTKGISGNKIYDVLNGCESDNTECVEKFTLRNNIKIYLICDGANPTPNCPPTGAQSLDVTYLRPNPDANINFISSGGGLVGSSLTGKVILVSPKGKTLTVIIESTGQVSIQ